MPMFQMVGADPYELQSREAQARLNLNSDDIASRLAMLREQMAGQRGMLTQEQNFNKATPQWRSAEELLATYQGLSSDEKKLAANVPEWNLSPEVGGRKLAYTKVLKGIQSPLEEAQTKEIPARQALAEKAYQEQISQHHMQMAQHLDQTSSQEETRFWSDMSKQVGSLSKQVGSGYTTANVQKDWPTLKDLYTGAELRFPGTTTHAAAVETFRNYVYTVLRDSSVDQKTKDLLVQELDQKISSLGSAIEMKKRMALQNPNQWQKYMDLNNAEKAEMSFKTMQDLVKNKPETSKQSSWFGDIASGAGTMATAYTVGKYLTPIIMNNLPGVSGKVASGVATVLAPMIEAMLTDYFRSSKGEASPYTAALGGAMAGATVGGIPWYKNIKLPGIGGATPFESQLIKSGFGGGFGGVGFSGPKVNFAQPGMLPNINSGGSINTIPQPSLAQGVPQEVITARIQRMLEDSGYQGGR